MKNTKIKFQLSIITINFNNKVGLEKTIESIRSQTWRNFEWIIIDGGSTDGSREILEKYSNEFNFYISEKDTGVYNAMNKGIKHVNGDYINFMNSGDTFYSNVSLDNIFKQNLEGDIVYGDWIEIYKDKDKFVNAPKGGMNVLIYFSNLCHQALFIRKDILQKQGFDESFQILADWKRWREIACEGLRFQYIPITICKYDCTEGKSKENNQLNNDEYHRIFHDKYLPDELQNFINNYYLKCEELNKFHDSILTKHCFYLSQKNIIRKIMHLNILFVLQLNNIIDHITLKFNNFFKTNK